MIQGDDKGVIKNFTFIIRHAGLSNSQSPTPPLPKLLQEDFYEAQCREVSLCLDGAMHYSSPEHYCKGSSRRLAIRVTYTHGNKEVYKPACGDDCPTVLETTEAYCGSSQWWLSLHNVKTQLTILHNNQGKAEQKSQSFPLNPFDLTLTLLHWQGDI